MEFFKFEEVESVVLPGHLGSAIAGVIVGGVVGGGAWIVGSVIAT